MKNKLLSLLLAISLMLTFLPSMTFAATKNTLRVKFTVQSSSIKLTWNKIEKAKKYVIRAKFNGKNIKLATIKSSNKRVYRIKKINGKFISSLNKNNIKIRVNALNAKNNNIVHSSTATLHINKNGISVKPGKNNTTNKRYKRKANKQPEYWYYNLDEQEITVEELKLEITTQASVAADKIAELTQNIFNGNIRSSSAEPITTAEAEKLNTVASSSSAIIQQLREDFISSISELARIEDVEKIKELFEAKISAVSTITQEVLEQTVDTPSLIREDVLAEAYNLIAEADNKEKIQELTGAAKQLAVLSKGDLITLYEKEYRVTSVSDNGNVKLLAMQVPSTQPWTNNSSQISFTTFFGSGGVANKYVGSGIETYFTNYYNALPEAMRNSIIPQEYHQGIYTECAKTDAGAIGFQQRWGYFPDKWMRKVYSNNVGERNIIMFEMEDVMDYYDYEEGDVIQSDDMSRLFLKVIDVCPKNGVIVSFALGTGMWCLQANDSNWLQNSIANSTREARPYFEINLSELGYTSPSDIASLIVNMGIKKGDIITLDDQPERYRVLYIEGSNAKLLAMSGDASVWNGTNATRSGDYAYHHAQFREATARNYLENTYKTTKLTQNIQDALILMRFYTYVYTSSDAVTSDCIYSSSKFENSYFINRVDHSTLQNLSVVPLDIMDIIRYCGNDDDGVTAEEIKELFYEEGTETSSNGCWTRSALGQQGSIDAGGDIVFYVNNEGKLCLDKIQSSHELRASFYVDLSKVSYKKASN